MNYWPRWIRAIRGRTLTLSMAQMGAYDRLLDYYYEEERPLPADVDECCRIAGASSRQDKADVQKVLAKFFQLGPDGYRQQRADEELVIGLKKIAAAKENGKSGGRPKGSSKKPAGLSGGLEPGNPPGDPGGTQDEPRPKAPHPQKEIPSEPVGSADASSPPAVDKSTKPDDGKRAAWRDCVGLLAEAGLAEVGAREFLGKLTKDYPAVAVQAMQAAATERPIDPKGWMMATAKRMAGEVRTVPSDAADRTQDYLRQQQLTPEQRAASAAAARQTRQAMRRAAMPAPSE